MKNLTKYLSWTVVIGILVFAVLWFTLPAFAMLGESIVYLGLFMTAFILFDRYVMIEIDTIKQLEQGNVAYALFLLAIAVVFMAIAILVG